MNSGTNLSYPTGYAGTNPLVKTWRTRLGGIEPLWGSLSLPLDRRVIRTAARTRISFWNQPHRDDNRMQRVLFSVSYGSFRQ